MDRGDPALRPLRPKKARDERVRVPEGFAHLSLDQMTEHHLRVQASAEFKAEQRLAQILDGAVNDPMILESEQHSRFAGLMRELLAESLPTDRLEAMLKPLETLLSQWRTKTGKRKPGRPKDTEKWAEWRSMFEEKQKHNRIATAEELYEGVAANWATAGHKPVTWGGVKNGIYKLRKLEE